MTDASTVEIVVDRDKMILQIPAGMLIEAVLAQADPLAALNTLTQPFAVIYRLDGSNVPPSQVAGFADQEALGAWLEQNYRGIDVVVVLRNGRPVKFKMRVRARIG